MTPLPPPRHNHRTSFNSGGGITSGGNSSMGITKMNRKRKHPLPDGTLDKAGPSNACSSTTEGDVANKRGKAS